MSNFTDFFPLAASGGGGGDITDPDKVNKNSHLLVQELQPTSRPFFIICNKMGLEVIADSLCSRRFEAGTNTSFPNPGCGATEATDDEVLIVSLCIW